MVALDRAAAFDRAALVAAMGSVAARAAIEAEADSRRAGTVPVVGRGRGGGRSWASCWRTRRGRRAGRPRRARADRAAGADLRPRRGRGGGGADGASSPATGRATGSSRSGRSPRTPASARSRRFLAPGCCSIRGAERGLRGGLAAADRHPHAGHGEPASCRSRAATSRRRCSPARSGSDARDRADGRPDARRRRRHQAGGLRAAPRARRRGADLPLVHDRDGRARLCDRVYVFREGAIVADLPRAEMTEEKVIHASFRARRVRSGALLRSLLPARLAGAAARGDLLAAAAGDELFRAEPALQPRGADRAGHASRRCS